MDMPLHPTTLDIALRLMLTIAAAAIIGLDRETGSHSAGLRTTILVALAASLAMIQVNLLLSLSGKTPGSFVSLDMMRLPLGVLTGVGFIGGGAILKRGAMVSGLTTAATLWSVTIIGLCFGGGQILLGIAATALIYLTLVTLRHLDLNISRQKRARVVIVSETSDAAVENIARVFQQAGWSARFLRQTRNAVADHRVTTFEVRWSQKATAGPPLALLQLVEKNFNCRSFEIIDEGTH
ncbi:magnesium transporter MgtC [Hyphomicrobium methylovorum]|uniref:MgtC/SapB family protein n=1 Tax=Hyphomicrobium methylovorum TaxID=84 RepID=UPI0015E671A9|nr:MgtC/SapB family protein [Hyphomicrobium methylovorum]MBA2124748.1 magnesium transporter MgtC [Hyphomicrobium methylovorum]